MPKARIVRWRTSAEQRRSDASIRFSLVSESDMEAQNVSDAAAYVRYRQSGSDGLVSKNPIYIPIRRDGFLRT